MSLTGGILILAVALLRAAALNRLPRGTFRILWGVAVVRLLAPFSIPSPWSVYTLAESAPVRGAVQAPAAAPVLQTAPPAAAAPEAGGGGAFPVWTALWLAGVLVCAAYFAASYVHCRRKFRTSLPVDSRQVRDVLADCRLRRHVSVRQSGCVDTPLTYGTIRPVILLPKSTDWTENERLAYVLEHELAHIRHFDAAAKLVLTAAACVHWFNPLAWLMRTLANRDMELSCDEAVVRRFGADSRPAYARTLISLEERRSGLGPFASAFSKNAIEERIKAIMKIRKRTFAAVLAAALLVCGVSVAFATSAEKNTSPRPNVTDGTFTEEELDRLAALWFEGYGDMTVADYQEKMWRERDNPQDIALLDRYGQYGVKAGYFDDEAASKAANAFDDYFYHVYEPLTASQWQRRSFIGAAMSGGAIVEYVCDMVILDRDALTVGEYERAREAADAGLRQVLEGYTAVELADEAFMQDALADKIAAILGGLSSGRLTVSLQGSSYRPPEGGDAALHAQISDQVSADWDRLLTPYAAFGLTYAFYDPDHDGNGLTMRFQGREVRGIYDEREEIWITEHTGTGSYAPDAVELYAVYTDGVLTGLRLATPEEQAAWTEARSQRQADQDILRGEEEREFPNATQADYDSILSLRTEGYREMTLADFNQRLLDWCNEHSDACDRIFCDVIWGDYAVGLTEEERSFVAQTCRLSITENAMLVRSLYTGGPEQDPDFSRNLPTWQHVESGITTAWCDLYYDLSYHISDKSAATVDERDRCVAGMEDAIRTFWDETPMDELLVMTEEDVVSRFQTWAAENSTDKVAIRPITGDNIHFEAADERRPD